MIWLARENGNIVAILVVMTLYKSSFNSLSRILNEIECIFSVQELVYNVMHFENVKISFS